jgi:hypothetical protein
MEPDGEKKFATGICPKPVEYSSQLFKIILNITLRPKPRSLYGPSF